MRHARNTKFYLRSRGRRAGRNAMDKDEVSQIELVEEFLQHALMKETTDYARRGRQYASAFVSDINDQWTAAFQAVFTQQQQDRIRAMDDSLPSCGYVVWNHRTSALSRK
jgi:hypothetical protein